MASKLNKKIKLITMTAQELIQKHADYVEFHNWNTGLSVGWDGVQWSVQKCVPNEPYKCILSTDNFEEAFQYLLSDEC